MGLLDALFQNDSGGGGGLLDLIRNSALNQQPLPGGGPGDQAQYGQPYGAAPYAPQRQPMGLMQPPQQSTPIMPQFAPATPQANAQPSPLDNARWPAGPVGAPPQQPAPGSMMIGNYRMPQFGGSDPMQANAQGPQPGGVVGSGDRVLQKQTQQERDAGVLPPMFGTQGPQGGQQSQEPGFGDKLAAGFKSWAMTPQGNPFAAIANASEGFSTGKVSDTPTLAMKNTWEVLKAGGVPPDIALAAVKSQNPDIVKYTMDKYGKQEKVRPATEEERKAYKAPEDLPMGIDATTGKPVFGPAGQKTNVSLNTVANPVLKGVGEQIVEQRATAQTAARQTIPFVHEARQALDEGAVTGQFADQKIFMQKVGGLFGLPTDAASNTEVFRAAIGNQVLAHIKALGANPSNADRDYIEKIQGGQVSLEEKSLRALLDMTEKYARQSIRNFNADSKALIGAHPDNYKDIAPLMQFPEPPAYTFKPPAGRTAPPAGGPPGAPAGSPAVPPNLNRLKQKYGLD